MFKNNKLFFWTVESLAVVLLFYFGQPILALISTPVGVLFAIVFVPVLISGFLYYMFHPILRFLEKKIKLPRMLGIVASVFIVLGTYVYLFMSVIPNIINQLTSLISTTVKVYPKVQEWVENIADSPHFKQFAQQINLQSLVSNLNVSYTDILKNLLDGVSLSVGSVIAFVASMAIIMLLVPIFLYYMLKDGHKFIPYVRKNFLTEDRYGIVGLINNVHETMSKYIFGLALNVVFIFVTVMIGYLVLGIRYALLFALLEAVMTVVPYVGPYIGILPMVLAVAFTQPLTALIAVIYVLVLQQINGSFIYPKIVGQAMHIHPVTVIVLMLVTGSLYGILGMIVAVPLYAIAKEVIRFVVNLWRNIRAQRTIKNDSTILPL